MMGPRASFLYASYAESLALQHGTKTRDLVLSRIFREAWSDRFELTSEAAWKLDLDKGGYRIASSVDGKSTGFGASILCLPAGERILTDIGRVPIDDIVQNKRQLKVAGFDRSSGALVWQDILEHEQNPGGPIVEVRYDGGSFRCTADHPVFVNTVGYVPAAHLPVGHFLRTAFNGSGVLGWARIRSVEVDGYADVTFNINVTPCHNYFVGGALVHNCADDPHLVKDAEADKVRERTVRWWSETMPSRLNDRRTGAMVIVMQRVHSADLSGFVLDGELGYEHLCFPMRADLSRPWETVLGFSDPRTEQGELLWPERFPESAVKSLEKELGTYATSGQLQQEPVPRGGGIFKKDWFQLWGLSRPMPGVPQSPEYLAEVKRWARFPAMDMVIASADTAYTEDQENDPSALTVWGVYQDEQGVARLMLMFAWREHLELHDLVKKIEDTCKRYGVERLLVETKASGISVIQEIKRLFRDAPWSVVGIDPRKDGGGDKVARAHSVEKLVEDGIVFAPDKDWADLVIDEMCVFPRGRFDDLTDTATQALRYLRKLGILKLRSERYRHDRRSRAYRKAPPPLYTGR